MPQLQTLVLLAALLSAISLNAAPQDTAEAHHQRGVEHHLRRCLDDASREYARALELDPPRDLTDAEWALARRFAPRVYTTPTEFFPLKDFAVILNPTGHPTERLIAYHFFWADDIDFPEDNDPCDHEVMWVQFAADKQSIEKIWTYFHGRILAGGEAAMRDARAHAMRPRINAQWGKHGSMPVGWEEMKITANPDDAERKYYPVGEPITLKRYNEGTFRKLSEEGRRLPDHPLGVRLGWPRKFTGGWADFVNFSRLVDPLVLLNKTKMAKVSRWNSATINQHFLTYNFRPKTEWPVADLKSQTGNAGRNSLRGPSYRNYNATLARTFTLSEQFKLHFQASAFNVTNTPHFSNPSGDFTSTAFEESRTTFGERSVRFGLKLTF